MTGTFRSFLCSLFVLSNSVLSLPAASDETRPLHIVVMDPLCARIACDCVAGYARRDYEALAASLKKTLERDVAVIYSESLVTLAPETLKTADVIVGKFSVVLSDAKRAGVEVRTLAMLTDQKGVVTQEGLFVVRADDEAKVVPDLKGRTILFGPRDCDEKYAAALVALNVFGIPIPDKPECNTACSTAAITVVEKDADAAVISSYAYPLLSGCGSIKKGDLRVVGKTAPVPFIGAFVTHRVSKREAEEILDALLQIKTDPKLLKAMESKEGFVPLPPEPTRGKRWPDFRGTDRNAISNDVPRTLQKGHLLWSRILTGHGLSGLVVSDGLLIVADKSLDKKNDIFRCLDADTGKEIWSLGYSAPDEMDYTNAPRATPVIRGEQVYLLGAFGDLHCVCLTTGKVVWKRNLPADFGAQAPTWGYCSTPLVLQDKLIVNPGGKEASVVALNAETGDTVWKAPGEPAAYASFMYATFGGTPQIIGYDVEALNAWAPETGDVLWRITPPTEGDFNVPTPIVAGEKLIVSSENNGTRVYGFDNTGRINATPEAHNDALYPDMSSPVFYGDMVLGNSSGLVCLNVKDKLGLLWEVEEDPFLDYCCLIAGNDRFLVVSRTGKLRIIEANPKEYRLVSKLDLFEDVAPSNRDVLSHPALVGNRLYIRNSLAVYCFLLSP